MSYFKLILMGSMIAAAAQSQTQQKSTSSYFDDSQSRDLAPKSIFIQGEVQKPGPVELSSLPIRSVALKEMGFENGKGVFKGAYFVNGYSLYDILNTNNLYPPADFFADRDIRSVEKLELFNPD